MPNGLPRLRTEGPDIGNALLGAERIKLGRQHHRLAERRNALLERRFGLEERQFEAQEEWREIQKVFNTLSLAMDAPSAKAAKQILNKGLGEEAAKAFDMSRVGDKISLTLPDGHKFEGPEGVMKEFSGFIGDNPSVLTDPDPEQVAHLRAWAAANGLSATGPEAKARKTGETRTIQKGTETVTEEWTGSAWREIGRGPKFKPPEEGEVPERVKRAQQLLLTYARRKEVNPVVAMLLTSKPELANDPEIKAQITAALPKQEQNVYERALEIVAEYYGAPKSPADTGTSAKGAGVTHVFDPVEGLTPVQP